MNGLNRPPIFWVRGQSRAYDSERIWPRLRALVEVPHFFLLVTSTSVLDEIRTLVRTIVPRKIAICDLFLLVGEHSHSDVSDLVAPVIDSA